MRDATREAGTAYDAALREAGVRRLVTVVDEALVEGGREVSPPNRKAAVAAVFPNPFAGEEFVEDLTPLFELGGSVGEPLTRLAMEALGAPAASYGKAALVGVDGEIEHAHALLHTELGLVMRRTLGRGKALIPCAASRVGPGASVDVPVHYVDAATLNSHYDGVRVEIPDAPRADELVMVVALGDGPRPFARLGHVREDEVEGEDSYAYTGGIVFGRGGRPGED